MAGVHIVMYQELMKCSAVQTDFLCGCDQNRLQPTPQQVVQKKLAQEEEEEEEEEQDAESPEED
ncbi:hypothetical protein EYF80_016822 [Liparis tanakae]|uniref:Uncharacterized protein n=1 Tax=Liparis tanakae TaxID=230148 RepID=A0A4Z2I6P5_9TELE|nr:hypothetical protein EYF80_016822 [Liparis tanakae]